MGFKHGVNFLTVLAMLGVRELLPAVSVGKQRYLEHKTKKSSLAVSGLNYKTQGLSTTEFPERPTLFSWAVFHD